MRASSIALILASALSFLPSLALALPVASPEPEPFNLTKAIFPLPRYDKNGKLERRVGFNPRTNACRISIIRDLQNGWSCSTVCQNEYYNVEEVKVVDNDTNEEYAYFRGINEKQKWRYHGLDGHRGFSIITNWKDWAGFTEAYLHIEATSGNRNMMGSPNCWYEFAYEGWGTRARAHCFLWCDQLNW